MNCDEKWFYDRLNSLTEDDITPWVDVWQEPDFVSPDGLVHRYRSPTMEDRRLHHEEQLNRGRNIDQYRLCAPAGFVEMNLYCLAFYAHRCQPLFSELLPLLEHYAYFEWMMHNDTSAPWYRDHLIHQIRVGVIGHHLLQCSCSTSGLETLSVVPETTTLICQIVSTLKTIICPPQNDEQGPQGLLTIVHLAKSLGITDADIDAKTVAWAWWMASLFHDTGYVFSFLGQLGDLAGNIYSFPLPDMMAGLQATFKEQSAQVLFHFLRTEAEAYQKWLHDNSSTLNPHFKSMKCCPPDPAWTATSGMGPAFLLQLCTKGHAAPGALNLVYVVERLMERGQVSPKFRFAAGLAALAILRHDTDAFRTIQSKKPNGQHRRHKKDDRRTWTNQGMAGDQAHSF